MNVTFNEFLALSISVLISKRKCACIVFLLSKTTTQLALTLALPVDHLVAMEPDTQLTVSAAGWTPKLVLAGACSRGC